ncbi:MAG: hypothetical protein ACKOW8_15540, partial [Flavobacteriales bacterium]
TFALNLKTMAQKESNHSSKDRTILWMIIPCTVAVSLLFTKLNHSMVVSGDKMSADFSVVTVESTKQKTAVNSDTTHHAKAESAHDSKPSESGHH